MYSKERNWSLSFFPIQIQFGSCESLPAKGLQFIGQAYQDIIGTSSSNVQSSSSQSDIRSDSERADDSSCTFPAAHPTLQNVPCFFNACISFLMQHGMDVVGIFRVSGSVKRVIQVLSPVWKWRRFDKFKKKLAFSYVKISIVAIYTKFTRTQVRTMLPHC